MLVNFLLENKSTLIATGAMMCIALLCSYLLSWHPTLQDDDSDLRTKLFKLLKPKY